jgi:hemolysin III
MALQAKKYDKKEEFLNILTHGIGFILSVFALIALVIYSSLEGNVWQIVSYSIYGASLVVLYLASTLFHWSTKPSRRLKLNVFDHASIYVLIAGTYTPLLLVTLRGPWGWSLFGVVWGMAITGIILKLFYTGRYNKISTLAYVIMGWVVVIALKPLVENLSIGGLFWLILGGLSYSIGAIFFLLNKLPYNHAIFHLFVLGGSIAHFITIFCYIEPQ